jgi:hypothetical protein
MKESPILHTFQPRMDADVFDHPQLVMHHGSVPAFPVGCQIPPTRSSKGSLKPLFR